MSTSKKSPTLVSPAGEMGFAHLFRPNTKFNADGTYSAELILSGDEAENFKALITKYATEGKAQKLADAKDGAEKKKIEKYELYVPFKPEEDKDGTETGRTIFNFKNDAKGKRKDGSTFEFKPDVVDAKRNVVSAKVRLGRGSTIKVAFAPSYPWANPSTKSVGVSFRLKAVQVIKLVEYTGGGAAAFGEEQGYESGSDADEATGNETEPSEKPNSDLE
jgi:hypothetical protein